MGDHDVGNYNMFGCEKICSTVWSFILVIELHMNSGLNVGQCKEENIAQKGWLDVGSTEFELCGSHNNAQKTGAQIRTLRIG